MSRIVFGMYPEALTKPDPAGYLTDYVNDILFKDIFELAGIRRSNKLMSLVLNLATNIGQEVNYDSLARETTLSKDTVMRYIDLLEQCFIIKVCTSFSTNLVNELKKGKKIYFCDTGVRNALLEDFSPLSSRTDKGALWENFFYMEKVKQNEYLGNRRHIYFWRTQQNGSEKSKEIDFVEVKDRKPVAAYECKFSETAHSRGAAEFSRRYPEAELKIAGPQDISDLLAG